MLSIMISLSECSYYFVDPTDLKNIQQSAQLQMALQTQQMHVCAINPPHKTNAVEKEKKAAEKLSITL